MENRYPETIIGFDCREMWLPNVESWSDTAKQSLLRLDIDRRLTIGRTDWNSIFAFDATRIDGKSVGTAPGYSLTIPDEDRTSHSFWDDDEDMMMFIREHADVYQQPFWTMAFSIVQTPKYESYLAKWLENYKSEIIPFSLDIDPQDHPEWTFLGYDVQDSGPFFWEGLGGGVYPDEIQIPYGEKWGGFLNKYHLLDDQVLATELSDWHEHAENHPYFAYGLYLMKAYPSAPQNTHTSV